MHVCLFGYLLTLVNRVCMCVGVSGVRVCTCVGVGLDSVLMLYVIMTSILTFVFTTCELSGK